MQNEEIKEYFNILCDNDYPSFINKYINTFELQRLKGIGFFCGCDYSKIHNVKYWYSRLDHSIAASLMTWHFTKDKTQTLAALFHDLGTPAFSHCVDYMLGDTMKQESSEKSIKELIIDSKIIKEYLKQDNVDIECIADINKYTIVENEKPKICVDRLDGVLGTCLIWLQYWTINDIKEVYENIIVLQNEDKELEIGFKNVFIAEKFFDGVFQYSMILQKNEDKFTMQFIADYIKEIIKKEIIKKEQLYEISEQAIIDIIKTYDKVNFNLFEEKDNIHRSDTLVEDEYCVCLDSKKRYVIPLVREKGVVRLNLISSICQVQLDEYLDFNDSKYSYVKGLKRPKI